MKWQKTSPYPEHIVDLNEFIASSGHASSVGAAAPSLSLPPLLARNTAALSQVNVVVGSQSGYTIGSQSRSTSAGGSTLRADRVVCHRRKHGPHRDPCDPPDVSTARGHRDGH